MLGVVQRARYKETKLLSRRSGHEGIDYAPYGHLALLRTGPDRHGSIRKVLTSEAGRVTDVLARVNEPRCLRHSLEAA